MGGTTRSTHLHLERGASARKRDSGNVVRAAATRRRTAASAHEVMIGRVGDAGGLAPRRNRRASRGPGIGCSSRCSRARCTSWRCRADIRAIAAQYDFGKAVDS
jgi:hypothetical protein